MTRQIKRVAIIGTGVIGASWTTLFLANGLEVVATDVAPDMRHEEAGKWWWRMSPERMRARSRVPCARA
jgi:3-hydroxyacyl-CoA dehydrogenase